MRVVMIGQTPKGLRSIKRKVSSKCPRVSSLFEGRKWDAPTPLYINITHCCPPSLSTAVLIVLTPTEGHSITHLNRDVESIVSLLSTIVFIVRTPGEGHSIQPLNPKHFHRC